MVQKKVKAIVWSENAEQQFQEILDYLSKEAPEAVEIVGNAILDKIEDLAQRYNHYPIDRFKKNNDGTYHAASLLSYRISFQVGESDVNISRIRHTSREPKTY